MNEVQKHNNFYSKMNLCIIIKIIVNNLCLIILIAS
jgi:hypothetical protein